MQIQDSIKKGLSGATRVYDFSEYGLSDFAGKTSVPEEQLDKILEQKGIRLDPNDPKQVIFSDEITEDMDYITDKIVIIDGAEISGRTLFLSGCLILYHFDAEWADPMIVKDGGLSINNSVIICKSNNREPMIKVHGKSDLNFKRCTFMDCSNCINATDSFLHAEIYDSDIFNCGPDFIVGSPYGYKIELKDSHIVINEYLDFSVSPFATTENSELLSLVGDDADIEEPSSLYFDNCTIENGIVSDHHSENTLWPRALSLYDDASVSAFYSACTFKNLRLSIMGGYYVNCSFVECRKGVKDFKIIENCKFVNSTQCIVSGMDDAKVIRCRFDNCFYNLITAYSGSLLVDLCTFNIKSLRSDDEYTETERKEATIIIVDSGGESGRTALKNCNITNSMYEYVELAPETFLVEIHKLREGNFRPLAYLFNCDFEEWIARNNAHSLINPNHSNIDEDYKQCIPEQRMINIHNCRGCYTDLMLCVGGNKYIL